DVVATILVPAYMYNSQKGQDRSSPCALHRAHGPIYNSFNPFHFTMGLNGKWGMEKGFIFWKIYGLEIQIIWSYGSNGKYWVQSLDNFPAFSVWKMNQFITSFLNVTPSVSFYLMWNVINNLTWNMCCCFMVYGKP
ncbi:hypothetical protein ACJX0J_023305, partial [Zea mays]